MTIQEAVKEAVKCGGEIVRTSQEDEEESWEIMRVASIIFHRMDDPYFNHLYGVCGIYLAWEFSKHPLRKFADKVRAWFKFRKYKHKASNEEN